MNEPWLNLENFMLDERSKSQKRTYNMISLRENPKQANEAEC